MNLRCILVFFLLPVLALLGCRSNAATPVDAANQAAISHTCITPLARSGVWYEIFVRSWYDTDGDGIGDLNGVTAKLDYLKSLGISGIWLMPINPSPSYHGYDITDYETINPQYGNMHDFEQLLREAHKRGIKVIMDLVVNHTSSQSHWFKAAQNVQSRYHSWFIWANPETNLMAISAAGGLAWHAAKTSTNGRPKTGGLYYMSIFGADMPDLNYDNPAVRQAIIKMGQFWLKKGVDGFRLDAARHIYTNLASEDGSAATSRKNIAWWTAFRKGLDAVNPHAYLVGEVTVPTAAKHRANTLLAPYLGPLDSVFDFPLAERLIRAAQEEKAIPLAEPLAKTRAAFRIASGGHFVDATFLSNHDQERVMSQLDDNPQHMRMAAAMLLTLPGRPFIYYGEELGTRGRKPDPNLREPMRWYRRANGTGETRWEKFSTSNSPTVSVEAEKSLPDSMLNHYKQLIRWRREISALRDGRLKNEAMIQPHIMAWSLTDQNSYVWVLHNLSHSAQSIPLSGVGSTQRFTKLLKHTSAKAVITDGKLFLPGYSSAVLN